MHRGMDVYNKHFVKDAIDLFHDPFYTQSDIVAAFSRYVAEIVKRFANEPTVFGTLLLFFVVVVVLTSSLGWELANDPRCASSLPATNGCTPQTITKWTATIAAVVKQNDPSHLVSAGQHFPIWSVIGLLLTSFFANR
jgi:mannan endo-1,4-beta-mannosidase